METVRRLDQLRGDAHPLALLAHAALHDVGDAELAGDLPDLHLPSLEVESGCAGRDLQLRDLGQHVQELLADAV